MSREEIQSLMTRAKRSLRSAGNLLDDGDHDFSMSRAYYAMFYAASAALLSRDVERSRHSGVIVAFGQHLVKSAASRRSTSRACGQPFADRSEGEYAGAFPSREAVERRPEEAREFVEAVARFLRSEGVEG
jgi:uncharacterized protein (UPF0332 family)